jgi:hypothetical protein
MPGFLVHQGAVVMCSHAGQAMPIAPNPRVTVSGTPIVTITAPYTVAGCPFVTPGGTPRPCVTGQWLVGATRVLAGGQPVVLQDSPSICAPNGTPMNIVSTQTRVRGT